MTSAPTHRQRIAQMRKGYNLKNIRSFVARYERDSVDSMTEDELGQWVDALPIPEFMAMCLMVDDEVRMALEGSDA
jgi:hypothetical protein